MRPIMIGGLQTLSRFFNHLIIAPSLNGHWPFLVAYLYFVASACETKNKNKFLPDSSQHKKQSLVRVSNNCFLITLSFQPKCQSTIETYFRKIFFWEKNTCGKILKMDQANQGNNSGAPADVPVKRKRGRPRKDPSKKRVENVRVPLPPGFARVNVNQPLQLEAVKNAHDAMVGQPVSGVIEAAFDAGYLLNVRVGNTDITLRGVVFKPGRYVPISSENDLAPNVQMIRRNEIPLPTHNQMQVYGKHGIHHINGTSHLPNESQSASKVSKVSPRAANLMVSKGKQVPALSTQVVSPIGSRGNVVPVLLQPVNLSNGITTTSPAPHLASSKGKQVPLLAIQAPPLSNGPPSVIQVPHQTNHQAASTTMQNEGNYLHQPMAEVLHDAEVKPGCSADTPFQTLLDEVIKRKSPSQCGNISAEDGGFTLETGVPNMNEPLSIKPLQAFQPNPHEQSVSILAPTGNERNGKMTELLQVVQENMMENQLPQVQHFHEVRSPESELEDKPCPF